MKTTIIRIISMILLVLTFIIIFGFSSQNGIQSGTLSNKITTIFINKFPYTSNLSIEIKQNLIEYGEIIVRKLAHFSIYTIVGMCIMTFVCTFPLTLKKRLAISLTVGIIYAITDEYHQSFVPGRGPSFKDVCIDTAGVFCGILIILAIISIYVTLKNNYKEVKND